MSNYDNDIFHGDLEDFYSEPEQEWEYDRGGYEQYEGYEDYEPSPYDGTYSEC